MRINEKDYELLEESIDRTKNCLEYLQNKLLALGMVDYYYVVHGSRMSISGIGILLEKLHSKEKEEKGE